MSGNQPALSFTLSVALTHISLYLPFTWEFKASCRSTHRESLRIFPLSRSFFSTANRLIWTRHMPAWLAVPPRSSHNDNTSCGVVAFSTRISSSVRVNVTVGSSPCVGPALRFRGLTEGRIRGWDRDRGGGSVNVWAVRVWRRPVAEEAWGQTAKRRVHRPKNLLAIWENLQLS